MTWSAWIKPSSLQPNAVIFSWQDGANGFRIGLDQGIPYVEVIDGSGRHRSPAGKPLDLGVWKHLAVTASGGTITIYVDGDPGSSLAASLPAMAGSAIIGGDGTPAFRVCR